MEHMITDILHEAFPPAPIGASEAFRDRGATYSDVAEFQNAIEGRTWDALDLDYLARRSDALSFLNSSTIVDVLPAYLTALVLLPPMSPVPDTLIPMLTAPSEDSSRLHQQRWSELQSLLGSAQKIAVRAALRAFAERQPRFASTAEAANASYWQHVEGGTK